LYDERKQVAKEPKDAAAGAAVPGGAPAKTSKRKKEFRKKREKRVVPHGVVCISATFNNTMITLTDPEVALLVGQPPGQSTSRVRAKVRPRPLSRLP